jgi:hypothetical protein
VVRNVTASGNGRICGFGNAASAIVARDFGPPHGSTPPSGNNLSPPVVFPAGKERQNDRNC